MSSPTTMGWRIRQEQSSPDSLCRSSFLFSSCERSGRNGLSQSTIRALVAHRWKSVGGAQSWDMVEQPKLDAWNVGDALTTSGQPLLASLPGRDGRRVLGLL